MRLPYSLQIDVIMPFCKDEYSEYHPKPESENLFLKVWDRVLRFIRSIIFRGLLALPIIILYSAFFWKILEIIVLLVIIEECMINFEWIKQIIKQMIAKISHLLTP